MHGILGDGRISDHKESTPLAFKFLKTGAESAKMAQRAAAEAEQRFSDKGKMFRFWLKEKEEARITFVDGDLAKEGDLAGYLDPPRYYEHSIKLNGSWNNHFICPERTDPATGVKCVICELKPDNRPSLVALFTVIDHRQVQSTKDKSKTWKDTKKLFVAKSQTFEFLTKLAIKRKGLAGCTFDASRVGDKSAAVGSMFEFVEKHDVAELQKLYTIEKIDPKTNTKVKVTNFTPADYEAEMPYKTPEELRKLLAADSDDPVPFNKPGGKTGTGAVDYSGKL